MGKRIKPEDIVGKVFQTNSGIDCVVVDYKGSMDVTVKFLDKYEYKTKTQLDRLIKGKIRNLYAPTMFGVGFIGVGKNSAFLDGKETRVYKYWSRMMSRGYSLVCKKAQVTYEDCYVCEDWHCFQNFADWCSLQIGFNSEYHLDKDILVKGNKVYSPDNCCFVPREINNIFTSCSAARGELPQGVSWHKRDKRYIATLSVNGRQKWLGYYDTKEEAYSQYKAHKEKQVKVVALEWKDKIEPRVFEALMNWNLD